MRTIQVKLYTFDELSDTAKQKAIEDFRQNIYEIPFLEEDIKYYLYDLLDEAGLEPEGTPKAYYSLGYSQGDGAMFEGVFNWRHNEVAVKQAGMYYHENSKHTYITVLDTGEEADQATYDKFDKVYVGICKKLEAYGYDQIESYDSDESIADLLTANEYEFTEDGSRA